MGKPIVLTRCIVKKTLRLIVESKGYYLVRVKANTPGLLKVLPKQTCFDAPDGLIQRNHKRHALIKRELHCFAYQESLPQWNRANIQTLIRVERTFLRKEGPHLETAYHITNHRWQEAQAAKAIRAHWEIENRLHWVKEVVLKEDRTPPKTGFGPQNLALINNWLISLYRKNGFDRITKAIRIVRNDFQKLLAMLKNDYAQ